MVQFSLGIFIGYVSLCLFKYGPLPDLSTTYYLNKYRETFSIILFLIAAPLIIPLMELRPYSGFKLFEFLTVVGVIFVSTAPAFKLAHVRPVHITGALISGISAVIVATLAGYYYIPLTLTILAISAGLFLKNLVFHLEMAAFLTIYILLLI